MRRQDNRLIEAVIIGFLICASLLWAHKAWSSETINLDAIQRIESGDNPLAYNKALGARGLFQITKICLRQYNSVHKNKIKYDELFNPEKNKAVAKWYFKFLETQCSDVEEILIAYNWGLGNLWGWDGDYNKLPKETRDYLTKYKRAL